MESHEMFNLPGRRALLAKMLEQERLKATQTQTIERRRTAGAPPISFAQWRLWLHHQIAPEDPAYHMPAAIRLTGRLDIDRLHQVFAQLMERHESLRTTFVVVDGRPTPQLQPAAAPAIALVDLQAPDTNQEAAPLDAALALAYEEVRRPFDLARGPLLRVTLLRLAPEEHLLLVCMHHIIADGWSVNILLREFVALYTALMEGRPAPLPELPIQYGDFAQWQQERLRGELVATQTAYWQQQLRDLPALVLPAYQGPPAAPSSRGALFRQRLPRTLAESLYALSQQEGVTPFMTLLASFQVLLMRYSGQVDFAVGSPVSGRGRPETEGLVGLLINNLTLRSDLSGNPTCRALLARVRECVSAALMHQDLPFEQVMEAVQWERNAERAPLFTVMFALQQPLLRSVELPGCVFTPLAIDAGAAKFDLTLEMTEEDDGLEAVWTYRTDLFDAPRIEQMAAHLQRLLAGMVAQPDGRIFDLPLLSEQERQQMLVVWNDTAFAPATVACAHERVAAQAARRPDALALVCGDERLTYGELNRRANQLARYLCQRGVGPERLVAVCMERSVAQIVALLATLKAGGAYLPLDPTYPPARLSYMIQSSGAMLLLTQAKLAPAIEAQGVPALCLDEEWAEIAATAQVDTDPSSGADRSSLAYVIYTSGSTGRPKGVQVEHGALGNLIDWHQRMYRLTPADQTTHLAGLTFDAAVWEIWPTLAAGATLHLLADESHYAPERLRDWLVGARITLSFVPTPLAEPLLALTWPPETALRALLTGGDRLHLYPEAALPFALINHYGPTENTVVATAAPVAVAEAQQAPPPIGRPIDNVRAYLLDQHLQPVPLGVEGDLYIGGASLARGYRDRPDLTAERFCPDPFGPAGARLYQTGDRCRYRPDGTLEFIGRNDQQVKLRGLRIELGEIEATLLQHPTVQQAAVVVQPDAHGAQRLIAYIVPTAATDDQGARLKEHLRQRLPAYMLPAAFVALPALPLTPHGKVDRAALAAGAAAEPHESSAHVAPRTPIEEILLSIWAELLHLKRPSIDTHFFEAGGHSLLATQAMARVYQLLGVELPLRSLFDAPTVAQFAERVSAALYASQRNAREPEPIQSQEESQLLPLSFAQQRLWFLDQLSAGLGPDERSLQPYHIAAAVRLTGSLDVVALRKSLRAICQRHATLRTTFQNVNGSPLQMINPITDFPMTEIDLMGESLDRALELARAEVWRPFALDRDLLLRATLIRLAPNAHLLLLTMHHIAADGWSVAILLREIAHLYEAALAGREPALPPLAIAYTDFARWQRQWRSDVHLQEQLAYWKTQLAALPVLELPTDRPRPAVSSMRGATVPFSLSSSLTQALGALSQREGATLFMTLLAAFQALLSRYSGQTDIAVGTPVANRTRVETEGLIGFFVNTLVMRGNLAGNPTFRELLARVREQALGAYLHQEAPFEEVVSALQPARSLGHTPLFSAMFALQNAPVATAALGDLVLEPIEIADETAKFDLTLTLTQGSADLSGTFQYRTDLFDAATIAQMAAHYRLLIEELVADPDRRIGDLPLLTAPERQQMLTVWNDTAVAYAQAGCIHEQIAAQAAAQPEAIALRSGEQQISYRELNSRANQLAHHLMRRGVGPEVRVGLFLDRSIEMIIGLLAILKAGGAYLPLDTAYPQERLSLMLQDGDVALVLTRSELQPLLARQQVATICLDAEWVHIEQEPTENPASGVTLQNLAYIIYTSGSTGRPKGVMIEHGALTNLSAGLQRAILANHPAAAPLRVGLNAPLVFDASVQQWQMLAHGHTLTLIAEEVRQDPTALVALIRRDELAVLDCTPTHLRAMIEARLLADVPHTLQMVLVGGEPISDQLWQALAEAPAVAFYNLYGPTECAVDTLICQIQAHPQQPVIGRPIQNAQLFLLDAQMNPVPVGVPGEIYIGGASVGRGYLNRPDLTAERFVPNPFGAEPGGRLYRTGDVGKYLRDGSAAYLHRLDQQVKMRGFRIELGEIEAVLHQHPAVREAVVAMHQDRSAAAYLVAYIVPDGLYDEKALRLFLRERLPGYMIPALFLLLDALPLTASGKVDRQALPEPSGEQMQMRTGYVAPRTALEELLASLMAAVLGVAQVGVHDDFFAIGGHSLLATQLIAHMRGALQIDLPVRLLFEAPTVAELALHIEAYLLAGRPAGEIEAIEVQPRPSQLPLSFAQQRLWFLDQLQPDSPAYVIPGAIRLTGQLDTAALERSLVDVIQRHESLRTTFAAVEGRPLQTVRALSELPPFRLTCMEVAEPEAEAIAEAEARRPFDLARDLLLRATLLKLNASDHILVLTMHHIASDGWSTGLLMREAATNYAAYVAGRTPGLPDLPIQYADFALWQRRYLQGDIRQRQLAYWKAVLADLPVLALPTDRPRPALPSMQGATERLALNADQAQALEALSLAEGATLFMTLLSAFYILLSRYSGQTDIAVGTPVANRTRLETQELIGFFVNTLVMRGNLAGNPTVRELLAQVRERALDGYLHQEMPFDELVGALQPERSLSHTPLFQVMFVLQNAPMPALHLPGLIMEQISLPNQTAKFDLTLTAAPEAGGLVLTLEYRTDLFDGATALRMLGHYRRLLEAMVAQPDARIGALPLMSDEERRNLPGMQAAPVTVAPVRETVHDLFAAQAARRPTAVAISWGDEQLTYGELAERAELLARYLRARGVGPYLLVGLCLERSPAMIIAMLATLQVGGAYVPIDPTYPPERIAYVLTDAKATVLLTQESLVANLPASEALLLCLDRDWPTILQDGAAAPPVEPRTTPAHLAYVIYTSGSTGQPKGVQVTHGNVVRLFTQTAHWFRFDEQDVHTLFHSYAFDFSVWEVWGALLHGGRLVIVPYYVSRSPEAFYQLLCAQSVTVLNQTPSAFRNLMRADEAAAGKLALRLIIFGGEALELTTLRPWFERHGDERPALVNMYGITETTVHVTYRRIRLADLEEAPGSVIGVPIPDMRIYLLDPYGQPVPVGVPGEIYVGGGGVARAYINRPDLTAERFLPDPWAAAPGAVLYRSGDLARYLVNGDLVHMGRIDQQVKLRGHRIELAEIEYALLQHPAVREALVLVREERGSQGYGAERQGYGAGLLAYVVPAGEVAPTGGELRSYLKERLPDYMIPAAYLLLPAMPLTANGKVDRRALPAPDGARPDLAVSYVAAHSDLEVAIAAIWREVLGLDQVGMQDHFFDLGGHSLLLVQVQDRLQQLLQRPVPLIELFRYPTIAALARYLGEGDTGATSGAAAVRRPEPSRDASGGVAIVGMAGRFPGAGDIATFWQNLKAGVESITFFTDEALQATGVDPALLSDPAYVKAKGALDGVALFDAGFFDYTPREAEIMDPQQRLFLECAWEALEHAGCDTQRYGGRVGVFAGASLSTYLLSNLLSHPEALDAAGALQAGIGNDKDYLATRVSYKLNLQGPSLSVQTACSTSLVATYLACQSLLTNQADIALAGGVSIRLPQEEGYLYQEGGINSPDGHCRAFDAQAQGTVGGNGVGVVVLKRLADALADGDEIYAVIRGAAVYNDGAQKVGFTAPSIDGQARTIAAALQQAGVEPESITYVEAHGTGTPLGDPIEIAALRAVFGAAPRERCAIGSVKTNVGHLDAAAGVAGLIKTALSLHHKMLVPSLHFHVPNPQLHLEDSPFVIPTALADWRTERLPRRAGVSSFGIGGTNAHLVLEEAPAVERQASTRPYHLLLLAAKTASALEAATADMAAYLKERPELPIADVAYTSQTGRRQFMHRRAVLCRDSADAAAVLAGSDPRRIYTAAPEREGQTVAFLFPGQGAGYLAMGRDLYASEPLFREQIDRCAAILQPHLGLDLRTALYPSDAAESEERLSQTDLAQPALFAVAYALASLLMHWGVRPAAMIGHSIGEYVAACIAGVFTLEEALALVAERGRLMQEMAPGAMLSVSLSAEALLAQLSPALSLAAVNGPTACVAAGPVEAIEALQQSLQHQGVESRRLHTRRAFHSAMTEPILERFEAAMRRVRLNPPQIPYLSNLTGTWITPAEALDPAYWVNHLQQTVRFGAGLAELQQSGSHLLLEVGPGQTLTALVRLSGERRALPALATMRHPHEMQDDAAMLLSTLGKLWLSGVAIDWSRLYTGERRRKLALPTYPFARQRYWIAARAPARPAPSSHELADRSTPAEASLSAAPASHSRPDLLGAYVPPTTETQRRVAQVWQEILGVEPVGLYDNFFEMGGHSVAALQLVTRLRDTFQIDLPMRRLFEEPTVAGLTALLEQESSVEQAPTISPIRPVPRDQDLPLSFAQQRVWFIDQLDPGNPVYNIQSAVRLSGRLDEAALAQSLTALLQRNEVLRTSFPAQDGIPVQRIAEPGPAELHRIDLSRLPAAEREAEAARLAEQEGKFRFQLATGPLFRATLLRLDAEEHWLILMIHHIISDGWSNGIIIQEVTALYHAFAFGEAPALPARTVQYGDFAQWQRQWLQGELVERQLAYWQQRLAGSSQMLNLPLDRPRPAVAVHRGGVEMMRLPPALTGQIKRLCLQEGVTEFMAFLALYNLLLHRYTGQEDILVGTPIANRLHEETQMMIGLFANTLVMRTDLTGNPTFRTLLQRVRETAVGAYANGDLPFERLVDALQPERSLSYSPLFQVDFVFHSFPLKPIELQGLTITPLSAGAGTKTARFDLTLNVVETPEGYTLLLEYDADLFEAATAARMVGHLRQLIESAVADPNRRIGAVALLTPPEREQLVRSWNPASVQSRQKEVAFSLFYFASEEREFARDKYRLLLEGARYADANGFAAVWTPERHFHAFGGIYPNPSVTAAALATITTRVALRAGSVVLPLQNPIRVAEEWSMIDNLSDGRAGIAFASGWHSDDFVFAPERYAERKEWMFREIETVRRLWRGEPIRSTGGTGQEVEVRLFPLPIQKELPVWVTAASSADTFVRAGQIGAHVLTNLISLGVEDLEQNIRLYKEARAKHGHDPEAGEVTVLLHTFVGSAYEAVVETVRKPMYDYLRSSAGLAERLVQGPQAPIALERLTEADKEEIIAHAFARYVQTASLIGTPDTCAQMIEQLIAIGVTEIGCLIDFGVDVERTLAALPALNELRQRFEPAGAQTDGAAAVERRTTVVERFEAQAAHTPEAVAVIDEETRLTYHELNSRANRLAHRLRRAGVGPEVVVGLLVERSADMIVGLLAILKAGGAYLPLDPSYPVDRLAYMLHDSGASLLLAEAQLAAALPAERQAQLILLDQDWPAVEAEPDENVGELAGPENLAYVIYTSGSTGRPKGVQIEHRSLSHLLTAIASDLSISPSDIAVAVTSLSFDVATAEIFMTLTAGATLVIASRATLLDGFALDRLLQAVDATLLTATPAMWRALLEAGYRGSERIRQISTGEALPRELVAPLLQRGAALINLYGPTETTVWSIGCRITTAEGAVPIGRPIGHTTAYLLDRYMQPVPVGVVGELYIGGEGLARGYLNRPELTAERFVDVDLGFATERLYRTGDLARYWPDGTIECLGRVDQQVKLRGFRIELGEIEAALAQHPAVVEAVVLLRENRAGRQGYGAERQGYGAGLIAYIVFGAAPATEQELRAHLAARLPDYMVPSLFVTLPAMPLTPSGKVDRKALPAPDDAETLRKVGYEPPQTAVEQALAAIWEGLLGIERVSIHDNFFALGGDSILSIQAVARANQVGLKLTPRQFFERPTIAELAVVAIPVERSEVAISQMHEAEPAAVTGPVMLTPIQSAFFAWQMPEPHHYNQAMMLETFRRLEPAPLEQALRALIRHHDTMRLRYRMGEGGVEQYIAGVEEVEGAAPLRYVDLAGFSPEEQQALMAQWAERGQRSLHLQEGPLLFATLFFLGEQQTGRLHIAIHHLGVDGVSWRILLEDLQTAYDQIVRGEPVRLPAKTTSFQQWAQRLNQFARSEAPRAELTYWLDGRRRQAQPLPAAQAGDLGTAADLRLVQLALTVDETRALLQEVSAAYRTHINDILLTALAITFYRWTSSPYLLLDLEGHGRAEIFDDIDLSRTVGWFTSTYPLFLEIEGAEGIGEIIMRVKEQIRAVPRRGLSYGLLRHLSGDGAIQAQLIDMPQPQVQFNYLGQFDQSLPEGAPVRPAPEPAGPVRSPLGPLSHAIAINGAVSGHRFMLTWAYSAKRYERATMERLAECYLEVVREIIAHCTSPTA